MFQWLLFIIKLMMFARFGFKAHLCPPSPQPQPINNLETKTIGRGAPRLAAPLAAGTVRSAQPVRNCCWRVRRIWLRTVRRISVAPASRSSRVLTVLVPSRPPSRCIQLRN